MKQCLQAWALRSAVVLMLGLLAPVPAYSVDNTAIRALSAKTTGKATLHRNASGRVTHLRSATTPLPANPTLNPDARARTVLNQYRDAFLDPSTSLDLVTTHAAPLDSAGSSYVRYQQRVNGIPVRGGDVIVHLDQRGVTAVHAKLLSSASGVATAPGISAAQALAAAERSIGNMFPKSHLNFTAPRLEFVNPDQLRGTEGGLTRLAWFTEAIAPSVREFVWIDAQRGDILLHFSQVAHASAVSVLDYAGSCLDPAPAVVPYDNLNLPPADSDAETAYNTISAAYTFFDVSYAWQGFDGADAKSQAAIVRVCDADPAFASAPEKAEWYKTTDSADELGQMLFASGVTAADDIVGHEYAHGIAEYSSGLNLLQQSGALAEGFADVFGEVIDQLQLTTNDTGDTKWAFGEDATGGPFRNLLSPGDNTLPGKVTDTNFYCGADNDLWIHRNGAVLSHAFALLADGGSYNGFTITGIGVQKAARIFFDTMTTHLTASSSLQDAYSGFKAAADLLVTSATITSSDRAQLVKVLDAVELNSAPCSTAQLSYCPTGQNAVSLYSDDFENTSSGKWINSVASGVNHWNTGTGTPAIYVATDPAIGIDPVTGDFVGLAPFRGSYALRADNGVGTYLNHLGDSTVAMASAVSIPGAASARLQFEGRFFWEQLTGAGIGPDGGIVEYSTNNGTSWKNVTTLISAGQGYTGVIQSDGAPPNPLALQPAFVGSIPGGGYASTQLDLSTLAGQSVQFRFRVGTDNVGTPGMGWQIDDVNIYTCTDAALVVSPTSGLTTSESGGTATFTVHLGSAPSESVTLLVASSNTGEGTVSPAELVFDSANYDQDQTVTLTGVDDGVSDDDTAYTVTVSVAQTNDAGYQSAQAVPVSVTNTSSSSGKSKGGGAVGLPLVLVMMLLVMAHAIVARQRRVLRVTHPRK